MTNLKNNIDHYMKLKGINKYTDLLRTIAQELGYSGKTVYSFVKEEKGNFSKMLNGKRELKKEFIIPLEKIFGVSLARLLDEDAYKLPVEKENIPFNKGFRYYAYLDDIDLYKKELDVLLTKSGDYPLEHTDEFEKTFLDYVIEYNAKNAVRYLYDKYQIKLYMANNQFRLKPKGYIFLHEKTAEFCRLVANMNDTKLFNDIFDPYYYFVIRGWYLKDSLFNVDDYFEIVLDHDNLFKDIFIEKTYRYELTPKEKKLNKFDDVTINTVNPVINGCLKYAVKHSGKYKEQAIELLKFGIEHNNKVFKELLEQMNNYEIDELGGLHNLREYAKIIDIVIKADVNDAVDKELIGLIDLLPKLN